MEWSAVERAVVVRARGVEDRVAGGRAGAGKVRDRLVAVIALVVKGEAGEVLRPPSRLRRRRRSGGAGVPVGGREEPDGKVVKNALARRCHVLATKTRSRRRTAPRRAKGTSGPAGAVGSAGASEGETVVVGEGDGARRARGGLEALRPDEADEAEGDDGESDVHEHDAKLAEEGDEACVVAGTKSSAPVSHRKTTRGVGTHACHELP